MKPILVSLALLPLMLAGCASSQTASDTPAPGHTAIYYGNGFYGTGPRYYAAPAPTPAPTPTVDVAANDNPDYRAVDAQTTNYHRTSTSTTHTTDVSSNKKTAHSQTSYASTTHTSGDHTTSTSAQSVKTDTVNGM